MAQSSAAIILCVDDDAANRRLYTLCLQREGFQVREAATGEEGLRLARERPDLVILDIHLPDLSGLEVCARIKADSATASIPVLHLSGVSRSAMDRTEGLLGGADGYLTKPVDIQELVAHVRALLRVRRAERAAREAALQWQTTFDAVSDAICQTDPEGVVLRCNRVMAGLLGRPAAEVVGAPFRPLVEESGGPADVLCAAASPEGRVAEVREAPFAGRWFHVTADPVLDGDGALCGTVHVWFDLTERKRAEEARAEGLRLTAFSVAVGVALTQTETLPAMLHGCTEAMVQCLGAALARVWTFDPEAGLLELQASSGLFTHLNGAHSRVPLGGPESGRIAAERRPYWTNQIADDPCVAGREWAAREGLTSFAGYPLQVDGRLVGVMTLFGRGPLNEVAVKALASAADSIGLGIQRRAAEKSLDATQEEFRVARQIQQKLFPRTGIRAPGFDVGGASYPAVSTGGDYYDFFQLCDGSLGVVIGDVSGHGVGPALLMASTRAYLHALALNHSDVSEMLARTNRALAEDTEDQFVTLLLARLDPANRSFTYASAGHPTGYVLDAAGGVKARLGSTAMPLGVLPETDFPCSDPVTLAPDEMALFLTDGIVEARDADNAVFGAERALSIARICRHESSLRIVENLFHAVRNFTRDLPQQDDISAVVVKAEPADAAPPTP